MNKNKTFKCIPVHTTTQRKICFREAASIIKIAHENNCEATLISGDKSADTTSILSVIGMRILAGSSIVITAEGNSEEEATNTVREILKLINTVEE